MERGPLARMRAGRQRSVRESILTYELISKECAEWLLAPGSISRATPRYFTDDCEGSSVHRYDPPQNRR
jgi:hypothetical protein